MLVAPQRNRAGLRRFLARRGALPDGGWQPSLGRRRMCSPNAPAALISPVSRVESNLTLRFFVRMVSASLVQMNGSHRSFQPSMKRRMAAMSSRTEYHGLAFRKPSSRLSKDWTRARSAPTAPPRSSPVLLSATPEWLADGDLESPDTGEHRVTTLPQPWRPHRALRLHTPRPASPVPRRFTAGSGVDWSSVVSSTSTTRGLTPLEAA
jgi:hypothetical protein